MGAFFLFKSKHFTNGLIQIELDEQMGYNVTNRNVLEILG